jgi:acyl-CoA synthetase (AMP-forming)/AMP-acid ligase II/thioesterase domain-containing protein/acyl carrier protein
MLNSSKPLTLQQLIANSVDRHAEAIAILSPSRLPLTYRQLFAQLQSTIHRLNSLGLGRGDRIAIVLPNGPEMAVTFLAVATCATSAPLNPAYGESDFDFYLSDLNAKALIIHSELDSPARKVASARNIPIIELTPQPNAEAGIFHLSGETQLPAIDSVEILDEDIALVLHTSGTTSRPKIVPLTQANLWASAHNISQFLQLTSGDRCLNVMPLFHIHGLIAAVLSSLTVGGSVVCTPSFNSSLFFDWMAEFRPTWYTAVPTIHQAVLTNIQTNAVPVKPYSLRFIRSSSAALPPQLMKALEQAFQVPVIEAFGMTEAAHQIASNPLPPGNRKARSVGIPAGPEVAIMDATGNLLQPTEVGEIVIRGANVTQGYENNPQANTNAFTDGWFRTGDQGYLDQDGYLYITGRLKELINRGGEKISPREIDEILLDHPAIAQAVTFAVPHPTLGENVAAAVVLQRTAVATEREIRKFAATKLPDFKVPSQIVLVNEIPKGPTGKLQRIGLAEKLADQLKSTFVTPQTETEKKLADIWAEILNIQQVGIRDNFFALGGDSLKATQMLAKVQTIFQVDLPMAVFLQLPTIAQFTQAIESPHQWTYPWYSLVPLQTSGSRPPLFGVHNLYYRDLAEYLGPEQPIYGLRYGLAAATADQLPILPKRIEDIAAHYIQEMQACQPEGPYFLMGVSSGGIIAFEMAQQLIANRQKVALLALFDSPPPGKIKRELLPLNKQISNLIKVGVGEAVNRFTGKIKTRLDKVTCPHQNKSHSQLQYNPTVFSPAGEGHFFQKYTPKPYPGKVTLFRAMDVLKTFSIRYTYDALELTWRTLCSELNYLQIPGNHPGYPSNILEPPHVRLVAKELKTLIDAALTETNLVKSIK